LLAQRATFESSSDFLRASWNSLKAVFCASVRLVEKYRAIFDRDVPDIDQMVADKLILMEVRKAIGEFEHKLLG
jgi:hypothetical protein